MEVAARAIARERSEDAPESADSPIGRTISHYRIIEKAGRRWNGRGLQGRGHPAPSFCGPQVFVRTNSPATRKP